MKRALFCGIAAAILALCVGVAPAAAQAVMKESSCSDQHGSNTITHDCGFNVKDYTPGTPVTFTMNYSCTGTCGTVTSFGLRNSGFTPGGVSGHLVGGKKIPGGIQLTFVFDTLKATGKGSVGNAHFKMNLNADDGSGVMSLVPCEVDVHLQE